MDRDKVCLKVPEERKTEAQGGYLEAWHLCAGNNKDEITTISHGIQDLIMRIPGIKPGDIAVLCRSNDKCAEIVNRLETLGIRASVGQGKLLDTKECRLALAVLRYMNNQNDSLALAEMMHLSAKKQSGDVWLTDLVSNPQETKQKWHDDPFIAPINEGRNKIRYWTPLEALEQAIGRIGLIQTIKAWPKPDLVRSNLDTLRGACLSYIDQCASHRNAATVDGFVRYLKNADLKQAHGSGSLTVNVLTYHSAKGLEWPWVVLADLNASPNASVFGINLEAASKFDMKDPLIGRKIRYWPWPFAAQKTYPQLDESVARLPLQQMALDKAEYEEQRLLYVGMTRAKNGLVLAIRKTINKHKTSLHTDWLDSLKNASGKSVIKWDADIDSPLLQVGCEQIPFEIHEYLAETAETSSVMTKEDEYLPAFPDKPSIYPAARLSPSNLFNKIDDQKSSRWEEIARFSARIRIRGNPEMDKLGSAVHTYLAMEHASLKESDKLARARKIFELWRVSDAIGISDLVAAGQRLDDFINQRYPGHKAYREWPMTLRNEKGQLLQGWIDLLLDTPDGYIIIDHKDYPGQNPEERARQYIPQLKVYQKAVEGATGRPVIDTLLHLPVSGLVLRLC